ncbi:MAG: DUF6320 domain-containing protein [Sphaerochaetaceae bacterium]
MAYCVKCGVKLSEGTTSCPLCQTAVNAPNDVIGEKSFELFGGNTEINRLNYPLFDKHRKGIIELVVTFTVIGVITLLITHFALSSFNAIIPIAIVLLGSTYLLVGLYIKITYVKLASWYLLITVLLLFVIDLIDLKISWSLYSNSSILLYWVVFVLPWIFKKAKRTIAYMISAFAILLYFPFIDYLTNGSFYWSLSIGIPTYIVVLVCFLLLLLRIRFGNPTITDGVLSLIAISSIGVVAGDFFHLRSIGSKEGISWSLAVAIVAFSILLFLILKMALRQIRHYFHNRIV